MGLIFEMLWVTSSSVEGFEFFLVASMLILNLAVVNTFWPIPSRSRLVHGCILGTWMHTWSMYQVHGSWLIVHGSF